jgi:hypothetical protein
MRKEKDLIALLEDLVRVVGEEAAGNPDFAAKLDALLSPIPESRTPTRQRVRAPKTNTLPDIHAEYSSRGAQEFQLWLRDQPVAMLRALIRVHDLDAARRASKWKDAEKLSAFITEQISARLSRGSGFLSTKEP